MKRFMTVSAFLFSAACLGVHTPGFAANTMFDDIMEGAEKATHRMMNGRLYHRHHNQAPSQPKQTGVAQTTATPTASGSATEATIPVETPNEATNVVAGTGAQTEAVTDSAHGGTAAVQPEASKANTQAQPMISKPTSLSQPKSQAPAPTLMTY